VTIEPDAPEAIGVSENCQTAGAIGDWYAPPLVPPRGLGAKLSVLGSAATALLKGRRLLKALRGLPRGKLPAGSGGPPEPAEKCPATGSIWDDPALWMLMMH
jgi:hypothetical protein